MCYPYSQVVGQGTAEGHDFLPGWETVISRTENY
jgi:hypothetical protein